MQTNNFNYVLVNL